MSYLLAAKLGGDVLGAGANYMGNKAKLDAARRAANLQIQGEESAAGIGSEFYKMLTGEYGAEAASYAQDLDSWRDAMGQAPVQMGNFDEAQYTIQNYLDPYAEYAQRQAREQLEQSAAARGGMFAGSGATAKALQDRAMELGGQFYGEAAALANQDKNFGYGKFRDKFTADRQAQLDKQSNLEAMLSKSGGARESMFGAKGGLADLQMAKERSIADLRAGKERAAGDFYASNWDMAGNLGKSLSNGLSSSLGGQGSLASRLNLDPAKLSDADRTELLQLLFKR
jgi:hypothetical protein